MSYPETDTKLSNCVHRNELNQHPSRDWH